MDQTDKLLEAVRAYLARYYPLYRPRRLTIETDGEPVSLPIPPAIPRPQREEDTPLPDEPTPAGCAADVLATLREVGHRLTTSQLLSELETRGRIWGESTVRQALAALVSIGTLTNSQRSTPRGYGLSEWS